MTAKKVIPIGTAKKPLPKATVKKLVDAKAKKVATTAKKMVSAPAANKVEAAQKQFLEWFRVKEPTLYAMALKRMAKRQKMNGFLDIFKSVVDVVKDVAPKVVDLKNQQKILDAQIKAAQAGQAPLNIPYTPVVANPNSAQASNIINAGANYGTTGAPFNRNYLLLGIPALGLLWYFLRRKRSRR